MVIVPFYGKKKFELVLGFCPYSFFFLMWDSDILLCFFFFFGDVGF